MNSVVLIDDDSDACLSLARALKAAGLSAAIHAATNAAQGLEFAVQYDASVAVIDLCLEERRGVESGFELLSALIQRLPACRVIVLTGHGEVQHGVRALQAGAANFLSKPADISHLIALIRDGLQQSTLKRSYDSLRATGAGVEQTLVGTSAAIERVREAIRFAATTQQSIFLRGETGVGKGLCAQLIHQLGRRASKKFVRYQASFGSADLVNSDLFGHRKGSFTGAGEDRTGLLSLADGGTLFLDEIDELPLATQVTLLGVLQERRFRRVGGNEEVVSDFRLITASNQDLEKCITDGKLRRDFYHRIAHSVIEIPALRTRKEDIAALAEQVLQALRTREQISVFSVTPDALAKLEEYEWPGNVRELQSVIEGAAYHAQYRGGSSISADNINLQVTGRTSSTPLDKLENGIDFSTLVEDFKLRLIEDVLILHEGNQVRAAEALKLDR